jgi:hypothetical protein
LSRFEPLSSSSRTSKVEGLVVRFAVEVFGDLLSDHDTSV